MSDHTHCPKGQKLPGLIDRGICDVSNAKTSRKILDLIGRRMGLAQWLGRALAKLGDPGSIPGLSLHHAMSFLLQDFDWLHWLQALDGWPHGATHRYWD